MFLSLRITSYNVCYTKLLRAELAKVAEESKKTLEEIKKTFAGANMDYIKENVLATKTIGFLKEQIKVEATKKQEKPKTDD